jgi:NitT/TauT family transport system permease protein
MSDVESDSASPAISQSDDGRTDSSVFGLPISTVIATGTVLAFLIAWEVLAQIAFARLQIVFPSLVTIASALATLLTTGGFYYHLAVSAQEVAISFVLAAVIGIVGGTALGANKFLADAVEPLIYYFSTIPKIVLYPLFLVALGVGYESKVAMGFFSAIFPIMVNTITGALSVRQNLVKVARVYEASAYEKFKYIYLPSMITHIINGLRLGIGVAIIGVLLGELAASQAGIGNQVQIFFSNLQTGRMYAALLIVFAVSFALNISLLKLQQALWRRGYGSSESDESVETAGF